VPSSVLRLLVAGSLFFLIGASQENKNADEKKPYCMVFVSGPDSDDESAVKLVNEVEKKIKEQEKWFRLAEDSLEADIRVEVTQYGRVEEIKSHTMREERSTGAQSGPVQRPALLELDSGYFIEFDLIVPRQFELQKNVADGRGPGSAAKELARRLRTICDTYCR
jgi:hypothetical protein